MSYHPAETVASNYAALKVAAYLQQKSISDVLNGQPPQKQHSIIKDRISKAAVDPIDGSPLRVSDTVAFANTAKDAGWFFAAYPQFQKFPFYTSVAGAVGSVSAAVVEAGKPVPIAAPDLAAASLDPQTATAIAVITQELAKAANPNVWQPLLSSGLGAAIDESVLTHVESHDGTEGFVSSGSTDSAMLADFRLMLDHVNVKGAGPLMWIASRQAANRLNYDSIILQGAGPQGGSIFGIELIISDGLIDDSSGGSLALVDLSKIAATLDVMRFEIAQEAAVQMVDNPDDPVTASTVLTSLWQENLVGLKASLDFAFAPLAGFKAAILKGIE